MDEKIMFPTDMASIWQRVEAIDSQKYQKTRNFLDGAVSYLSPYITHGVISPKMVQEVVLNKYGYPKSEKLIQELAWREFFAAVWEEKGAEIHHDLRFPQSPIASRGVPKAMVEAQTGIHVIDEAIKTLKETGYMHNHARMWLASVTCNVGQYHWKANADWLYYHLLDGDLASNSLSWQWVAGAFASKKYWANQENVNRYSKTKQFGTFLDYSYEELPHKPVPEVLKEGIMLNLQTKLPENEVEGLENEVLLYHAWSLDPKWQTESTAQRVLVLEPSVFTKNPMSEKRIGFILDLAREVEGIQVYVGELNKLKGVGKAKIKYRANSHVSHWDSFLNKAEKEKPEKMFYPVMKYYKSFFAYWKACQKTEEYKAMKDV